MKPTDREEFVTIGKIIKTRGLHGEVKVLPLTDIPDRFESLETVSVHLVQGQDVSVEIEAVNYYKDFVYLQFQERNSVEDVQDLIGGLLQVAQSSVPELPEGIYYHFEIIGSTVYTEDSRRLGEIVDILETGSHDIYVVQGETQEYLIPAVAEFIQHVDRARRSITIRPPDGLLDL